MRWPFTKCDIIYLCLLLYYVFFNLSKWSSYATCEAPVQIFLVAAQLTFFVMIICLTLLKASDLPDSARKWITHAIHWIMNPICVYLPIQGAIWQIKNIYKSPACPAVRLFSFSIWTWIFCVFIVGLLFSFISYLKVKHWWRIYQFRRRMMHLNHMVANGDYDRLSELLLSEGDINDKVGLMPSDIEKLEKKEYQQNLSNLLQENTCPICYEDFKPGDQTVALPKCDHTFHPECVNGWLLKSPLCPMCRGNVRNGLYNLNPQTAQGQNGQNGQYRPLEDLENPQGV